MDSRRLLSRASRCRFVSLWRHKDGTSFIPQPVATHCCPLLRPAPSKTTRMLLLSPLCFSTACARREGCSPGHAVQRRQAVAPKPQLLQAGEAGNRPQLTQPVGAQLQQCQRRKMTYALSLHFRQNHSDAVIGTHSGSQLHGDATVPMRWLQLSQASCSFNDQQHTEDTLLLATYRSDRCCPDREVKGRSDLMPLYDSSRRRRAVSGAKSGTCGHRRST